MSRGTAPYLLTPIQRPRECQPIYVLGPELGPSYSQLRSEIERLQEQVDTESLLRVQAQERLNRSMRVLASLGRLSPRMADLVAVARKEVWR